VKAEQKFFVKYDLWQKAAFRKIQRRYRASQFLLLSANIADLGDLAWFKIAGERTLIVYHVTCQTMF